MTEPTLSSTPEVQPAPAKAKPAPRQIGPCVQHAQTAGSRRCDRCRAIMCKLCTFSFEGNLYVCPKCVAAPAGPIAGKRTGLAIAGLMVSGLSVATLGATMSGIYQPETETALNLVFLFVITLPAAVGLAISYSAMDKNRGNNALLWTASVVSSVQMAAVFGLIVYGNLQS